MIPEPINFFIERFSKLPSFGPRMATRLAFYLSNLDKNELKSLEVALSNLRKMNRCGKCFFTSDRGLLCSICMNVERDNGTIAIVEKETDLLSLEKTRNFNGHYLVLGELAQAGMLEPAQKLRLEHLKNRIQKELGGKAKEVILALSLTTFGDFTADLVKQELQNFSEKITRLGRGIPTGGEIEFADEETLSQALKRRV